MSGSLSAPRRGPAPERPTDVDAAHALEGQYLAVRQLPVAQPPVERAARRVRHVREEQHLFGARVPCRPADRRRDRSPVTATAQPRRCVDGGHPRLARDDRGDRGHRHRRARDVPATSGRRRCAPPWPGWSPHPTGPCRRRRRSSTRRGAAGRPRRPGAPGRRGRGPAGSARRAAAAAPGARPATRPAAPPTRRRTPPRTRSRPARRSTPGRRRAVRERVRAPPGPASDRAASTAAVSGRSRRRPGRPRSPASSRTARASWPRPRESAR